MSLISVVIPVYNNEKTIQKTIESVLKQTFSDFEILVINDGSQDATLDIIASIEDSRLKVFSYPNSGVVAIGRNRGISHACGEFIAFLDADDLWAIDKLETQLEALQSNPHAALAYSWVDFIDEFGQPLGAGIHKTFNGDVFAKILTDNFIVTGSNPLIRKQALIEVGGFDDSLALMDDWDMWLRLAAGFHFVAVSSSQILYRRINHSQSMNVLRLEKDYLKLMERAFSQAPDSLKYLKRQNFATFYKFLTLRALEVLPGREIIFPSHQKGIVAIRFLWHAVRNNPTLLLNVPFMLSLLVKIVAVIILPRPVLAWFMTRLMKH